MACGTLLSAIAGDESEMRRRPVRVGDVFALSDGALTSLGSGELQSVREAPVIVDVSASGREAAKVAFYAAAVRPVNPKQEADRELAEIASQMNRPR